MSKDYGLPIHARPFLKLPVPIEYEVDGNRIRVVKMREEHIWIEGWPSIDNLDPLIYRGILEHESMNAEELQEHMGKSGVSFDKKSLSELEKTL